MKQMKGKQVKNKDISFQKSYHVISEFLLCHSFSKTWSCAFLTCSAWQDSGSKVSSTEGLPRQKKGVSVQLQLLTPLLPARKLPRI